MTPGIDYKLSDLDVEPTDREIFLNAAVIMDMLPLSLGSCFAIRISCSEYHHRRQSLVLESLIFLLQKKYCRFYDQPMSTLWDVTREERVLLLLLFAEAA